MSTVIDDKVLEAVCRAICTEEGYDPDRFKDGSEWRSFSDHAEAAIEAYEAARDGGWKLITDEHKNGAEFIVGYDYASVWIVHKAYWSDGTVKADDGSIVELWRAQGYANQDEATGWWSNTDNSVTQTKLVGYNTPTHCVPCPEQPEER